ncbi:PREDICTED: probable plastid-lipid-associated protein 3, chloroplastic [Camelina sativa]|uniref:Probable plastid-lipid-associated protein 3, chloroplastic n=1 Tax=Camelina sativa TaxID=90675 RepID=A0ABM0ZJR2_CAMSA|nr:PREDICTED: probable plastid-lipid-associated protein 3, chloroplastic [Camelina sativa]
MATLFTTTARSSLLFVSSVNPNTSFSPSVSLKPNSLSFSFGHRPRPLRFSKIRSSLPSESESNTDLDSSGVTDEWGEKAVNANEPPQSQPDIVSVNVITDEWGEKSGPEIEESGSRFADSDPPRNEDEWEEEIVGGAEADAGNGSAVSDDNTWELKRCLADTVYGTELGFRAGSEVRAEVLELVNQLEALNPTPAPLENPELLDGNWFLLYTAFSELIPLLAAGSTPLLKVKSISQSIDSNNLTIDNSTTLSSPFADFSFSATASFEVRSPSRVEVSFKEGTLKPPEIKSSVDLPESVGVFGQQISLALLKQSLNPLQDVAANISRALSGQPPLKLPIPGNRASSWLLTTYLDKDLRISRGDGGLFVLAREGSSLLEF